MSKIELAPGIFQYPFDKTLSKKIIDWAEKSNSFNWNKSMIGQGVKDQDIRTSIEFPLTSKNPSLSKEIKNAFIPYLKEYASYFQVNLASDEGFNLLKYNIGNSYDYHIDASPTSYRVISSLIYLNPQDYDGGETHFSEFDIKIKPKEPSIVFFPSDYAYIHAALPVTLGSKFIIVSWFSDRPK